MLTWIAFIASTAACFVARPHPVALAGGRRASRNKRSIHVGKPIAMGPTGEASAKPRDSRAQDFITGLIG